MKSDNFPTIIYGTAWKEDKTEMFVSKAIASGFKAIDTANQRKHYYEEAVGKAIKSAINKGMKREALFIQTKFTSLNGQDHRLPYDPKANSATQVRQSFLSSLDHLQISHIDSYVLHGPSVPYGLSQDDWDIWSEMEKLKNEGKVTFLGISNVDIDQLTLLYSKAKIKPTFVQNRCYAQYGWDSEVREFCLKNNIHYQGFSLLTANPAVVNKVNIIASKLHKTPQQIIFRFSQKIGMIPLTGTTDEKHMKEDLALDFDLTDEMMEFIEKMYH